MTSYMTEMKFTDTNDNRLVHNLHKYDRLSIVYTFNLSADILDMASRICTPKVQTLSTRYLIHLQQQKFNFPSSTWQLLNNFQAFWPFCHHTAGNEILDTFSIEFTAPVPTTHTVMLLLLGRYVILIRKNYISRMAFLFR